MTVLEVYKVGVLDWEISILDTNGSIIYYFRAATKRGAERKGRKFIKEQV